MSTYFPAFTSSLLLLITVHVLGFSKPTNANFDYCTPVVAKENISFEKLQIGAWAATQPNATVPLATFGNATPNYDFSLKGTPLTRDTFYWQIWVDLNGDLDFEDLGENLLKVATSRKQKAIGKLTLPKLSNGTLMVRIMLSKTRANTPCGTTAKVMDYYDFSIYETCPEVDADQQVKIDQVLENQATFSFDLASNVLLSWQIKAPGEDWTAETTLIGGSLTLKNLKASSLYTFRYRLQCKDLSWTAWSDLIVFTTKDVPKAICPAPSLDSVKTVFTNHFNINLTYTGKEHRKVIWNYPSYYQECSNKTDTTQRQLDVWYKNGERVSVRLKGVCNSGEVSAFSDTLWFERPCEFLDTSRLFIKNITDKSARVAVGIGDYCSFGYYYYITTDTTLHDSLWTRLPDDRGGYTIVKNLLPDTRYFIKFRGQCNNAQKTVFFSRLKSFRTHPQLTECPTIESSEVKFRNFRGNYIWVSIRSTKVSAGKELLLEDVTGYQSTRFYQSFDSISVPILGNDYTDTKYQIRIKNQCGELESAWSAPIAFGAPAACAKINPERLRYTFENDKLCLTYAVNPELPIKGPYLWRYRISGGPWVDTLTSDTNFVEFPASLVNKYVTFSVIPLASLGCGNAYWSEYSFYVFPCSVVRDNAFGLKSITSNSATFYINRDRLPTHVKLRYQKANYSDGTHPFVEVAPTATEVTINKLAPNTRYVLQLCNDCQVGPSAYSSCTSYLYITTPKANFQPEPTLSLAKSSLRNNIKLVPNPSPGLFQMELPTGLEGNATLSITNLNGQLIQRVPMQLLPGVNPQLDLSQQTQGVYFIHLQLGKQVYSEKLVLIR